MMMMWPAPYSNASSVKLLTLSICVYHNLFEQFQYFVCY